MGENEFERYAREYRNELLENVIPFWMKHSLDASGAINNCLDDAGNVVRRDRYIWSQGRALWTFSAMYNRVEPREEWLNVARGLFRYLSANGRDERGRWMFRLDGDGSVLERDTSIYADGFVLAGLGEYYTATANEAAAALAVETYENVQARLAVRGSCGIAPYVLPAGTKVLGVPMIFSFFFHNLGNALGRPDIRSAGYPCAREVLRDFYIPEKNAVLEFVNAGGGLANVPEGRVCVPGHVIEAMWFLISIFEESGDDESIALCVDLIQRHLELGWDEEYGGVRLAVDVDGREPVAWQKADYKPWWVQVECLVATAYAYVHSRADWCLEWHARIRDYAYSHYPLPNGEWAQWLDRYGNRGESAALPVKDPFHLPRGLIYLVELFGRRIPERVSQAASEA